MKKYLCLVVILLSAHAFAFAHRAPIPEPVVAANPSPALPAPAPTPTQRIMIGTITGATADEVPMIYEGLRLANAMLDRQCFRQWVLAAKYSENNGFTQQQIFDQVESQPSKVDVEMYTGTWKENHISKTVGWEADPFDGVVHMNRYFVNSAAMVGDNLIHEDRGHSIGFHHYQVHSTSEPYGMNYAYEGCSQAQQMQSKGGKPFRPPGLRIAIRRKKAA